jgi:GntR family transcriptional regulator, rspAB operon transcriptional repressor
MISVTQKKSANRENSPGVLLGDQAYFTLKQLLTTGEIRAGEFMSIADLSARIGLPIAPIRDAVKKAEAMGLLQVLPKRGIIVLSGTPKLIDECFRLRAIFDQEGARLLARTKTNRDLHSLRARHVAVLTAARKNMSAQLQREALEVDWELHAQLSAAHRNDSVAAIYEQNRDKLAILQSSRPFLPDRLIPAMKEHLAIIDAIMEGDESKAAKLVGLHLTQSLRWWGIVSS